MPNRILKESICISDSVDSLSFFEECLFYRLIVNCDDFGRYDGRTAVIKGRLFPLKSNVTDKMIENGLNKLCSVGIIGLYENNGKPYLYMCSWEDHQTIRNKKSKYPDPFSSESTCKQMISSERKCPRNPIQSESESISESESQSNAHTRDGESEQENLKRMFDAFWFEYPRKQDKAKAIVAFKALNPTDELLDVILDALRRQKASEQWQNPKYIPMPTTWLHGRRWEDEAPKAPQKNRYSALEALMAQTIAEEGGNA